MGLGKTLMILSLICAHPRDFFLPDPSRSAQVMMERGRADVPMPVKATLIVPSLPVNKF